MASDLNTMISVGNPGRKKLMLAVLAIGVATGLATYVMKMSIKGVGRLVFYNLRPDVPNYLLFLFPVVAIVLAMIYQRYIVKEDLSHGTAIIKRTLKDGQYRLPANEMYSSIIGCMITIGLGGSAGAEGPSAATGAAIASNFGRWMHIPDNWMRILIGCGAGAGIAGIFKSPVGGMLFTLEVLAMPMTTISVLMLTVTCLIAGCTSLALGGFIVDIKFIERSQFDIHNILWMVGLGLFAGVYSVYYNWSRKRTERLVGNIRNIWVRAISGGLILSVAMFFFPALYGEGYPLLTKVINGESAMMLYYTPFYGIASSVTVLLLGTLAIILLKGIMVSATISGGGIAGDFAPTLFAGCLVGFLYGTAANQLFGITLPVQNFAIMGMAAVMAATLQAPLMAVFITVEMSNCYHFLFGITVVAAVAYFTTKLLSRYVGERDSREEVKESSGTSCSETGGRTDEKEEDGGRWK